MNSGFSFKCFGTKMGTTTKTLATLALQVNFDFSNQQVILNVHYVVHHGNMAILNFTKQFAEKAPSQRYQCPI